MWPRTYMVRDVTFK